MRFKIDENLPVETSELFRQAGIEAETVHEEGIAGAGDDVIAEVCRRENRILVTLDNDFADIRAYPPGSIPGVVVLRLLNQDRQTIMMVLGRLIRLLHQSVPWNQLWIVSEDRVRIRGTPASGK